MIGVASMLGLLMTILRRDSGYVFVLVWSFAGIAFKQADTALVANSAWVATAFVLALAIYGIMQRRRVTA